MTKYLSVQLK